LYQVASAGLNDGSVTLPSGYVNVKVGQLVYLYIRYSKRELHNLVSVIVSFPQDTKSESTLNTLPIGDLVDFLASSLSYVTWLVMLSLQNLFKFVIIGYHRKVCLKKNTAHHKMV
jgi:hypothetical protein